jgi:hypothetical protein
MEANRGLVTGMPGAGLTNRDFGKVLSETPALEPYWGKPAVRNLREEDGNVGIIRSPISAILLPDLSSPSINRFWESGKQSRARGGCALHCGNEPKARRRYREAKATKRRGKGGRKSECLILCAEQRIVQEG